MTERGIRPAAAPHVGPALLAPYRSRTLLAVLRPAVPMRDQPAALLALRVLGDPRGLPVRLALPPSRALRLASLAPFRPWPRSLREGLSSAAARSGGSSVPRPIASRAVEHRRACLRQRRSPIGPTAPVRGRTSPAAGYRPARIRGQHRLQRVALGGIHRKGILLLDGYYAVGEPPLVARRAPLAGVPVTLLVAVHVWPGES